ncbi:MAG: peptide deformylase [Candidatus Didemnitutus sp.]|nr:peptide deformylase [Candidatus Didemnitutus sp.]
MPLRIVHYDDAVLRKKGAKITTFDAPLRKLAAEMVDTMHGAHGIGLAAQQIGQAIQLCVIDLRETEVDFDWELDGAKPPLELFMPMVIINPVIDVVPEPQTSMEEGCLSFPEIRGDVTRPDEIAVKYHDEHGTPHSLHCNGLFARCVQHEADHLNGVLFISRMDKETLELLDPQLKALKKQTREAAKK